MLRSFGDVLVKDLVLGEKTGVFIAALDVFVFKIKKFSDFLFLGYDGIFDKVNNEEIVQCFLDFLRFNRGETRRRK